MENRNQSSTNERCFRDNLSIDEILKYDDNSINECMDEFGLNEKKVLEKTKRIIGIENRNRHKSKKRALASMINHADNQIHLMESRQFAIQLVSIVIFFLIFPFTFIMNSEFGFFHLAHDMVGIERIGNYVLILMFSSTAVILFCLLYIIIFSMKSRAFNYRENLLSKIGIVGYDQSFMFRKDHFCLVMSSPLVNIVIFMIPASTYSFFAWKLAENDESVMKVFTLFLILNFALLIVAFAIWFTGLSQVRGSRRRQGKKVVIQKPSSAGKAGELQQPSGPQAWRGRSFHALRRSARSKECKNGQQGQAGCAA